MAKATGRSGVLGKREPQKYVLVGSESNCEKMGYAKSDMAQISFCLELVLPTPFWKWVHYTVVE